MKRTIAALFLAGFAAASFAHGKTTSYADSQDVFVKDANSCPAGYTLSVPSYGRQNGHFARNGWLCENLDQSRE